MNQNDLVDFKNLGLIIFFYSSNYSIYSHETTKDEVQQSMEISFF